jgi:hypothetical protein
MAGRRKNPEATASPEVAVREIKAQHPKEWLLVGVTRRNERDEPTHGCLLYASKSEDQALRRLKDEMGHNGERYSGIAVFWADPRFPGIVTGPWSPPDECRSPQRFSGRVSR